MKNRPTLPIPTAGERLAGWIYLPIYLVVLPLLLSLALSGLSDTPKGSLILNLCYGVVNVLVLGFFFRRYLLLSADQVGQYPGRAVAAVLGGISVYFFGTMGISFLTEYLMPGLENVNNAHIAGLAESGHMEVFLFTVALAPIAEELLFRGLVFASLYERSRVLAYVVSMCAFSLIHVLGFVGSDPALTLALCFLQYLPAGFGLAWAMEYAGSIWASIGVHMLANILAMLPILLGQ